MWQEVFDNGVKVRASLCWGEWCQCLSQMHWGALGVLCWGWQGYSLVGHVEMVLPVSCPRSGFVTLLSAGSSLQEEVGFNPAQGTLQMGLSKPGGKWLNSQAKGCLSFPLGVFRAVGGSGHPACEDR